LLLWFDGIFGVSLVQIELDLCVAGQREAEVPRLRCRLLGSLPQVACDSVSRDTHFCCLCYTLDQLVLCYVLVYFGLSFVRLYSFTSVYGSKNTHIVICSISCGIHKI
jgi:hypothetical protein